jgi:hypothetical protein
MSLLLIILVVVFCSDTYPVLLRYMPVAYLSIIVRSIMIA